MDVKEIRLERLRQLLAEQDNNKAALARYLKKAPAQISQWFNGVRTITEESARDIEQAARKPDGWMDRLDTTSEGTIVPIEHSSHPDFWPFKKMSPRMFFKMPVDRREDIQRYAFFVYSEWERENRAKRAASE